MDNNFNIIKPVESLHNISNLNSVGKRDNKRKQQKKKRQSFEDSDSPAEETVEISKQINNNAENQDGQHLIDYKA